MIVVTGGAGFIGSNFVEKLNNEGIDDIVIVDHLGCSEKWKNLVNLQYSDYLHKDSFLQMVLEDNVRFPVEALVHMGACSSTTEPDADYLMKNNFHYSCRIAEWALKHEVRLIYASSAATYGDGSKGFNDDEILIKDLRPVNMYGYSKQLFDQWCLRNGILKKVAGIKFFNVFGPNEYHKGDMTSVVYKAYNQILETGCVRLFKSYSAEYPDGGQRRDFVYVKDCAEVLWWLMEHEDVNGIFNLGTGRSRTWNELVRAVFSALEREPRIEYINMPEKLQAQYQNYTEAKTDKLLEHGCPVSFKPLEDSVRDYVVNYLSCNRHY
ncbi:MAG TPA: ADP-glyceromanno-heptose 6-epimerase [Desulfobacteraceae bacterium]|nr:ADP-glyceromanno-heptose 6-epimerase [Desulfobacteraceae bacterium]HPJ68101.1 ADP-glyceromanno-heptose 6-epimerase [Desulfobacteraceae bacterium]